MCHPDILNCENTVLVIIDFQEKLLTVMPDKDKLIKNTVKMIEFAKIIGIPIIVTEQYPKGLGPTVSPIKELIPDFAPIEKLNFSATACKILMEKIEGYSQIILMGVETHICILQTALGLSINKQVHILADAVMSRTMQDHQIGLQKCAKGGCIISSVEIAMYEIIKKAGTEQFKSIRHLLV